MNLKYIKASVYVMSALIVVAIPVLIIGVMKTASGPKPTPAPANNNVGTYQVQQNQSPGQVVNVTNLEKFGNININSGAGFVCNKPQFTKNLILLYCANNTTHKQKIISLDLYKGAILGTITY